MSVIEQYRKRVEAVGRKLEESERGVGSEAILERRRAALARPVEAGGPEQSHEAGTIRFSVAGRLYMIAAREVMEVGRVGELTLLPSWLRPVIGLTAHRGDILPLIDPRALFETDPRGLSDLTHYVVTGDRRREVGLLAEEVHELPPLEEDRIYSAPDSLRPVYEGIVRGVTEEGILVLSGSKICAAIESGFSARSVKTNEGVT